jgi:hypothetical protein
MESSQFTSSVKPLEETKACGTITVRITRSQTCVAGSINHLTHLVIGYPLLNLIAIVLQITD